MSGIMNRIKAGATRLKKELRALYLAYKDPRVSWYAKAFTACVVGYALSPIDLIPDFIPVLGYLDDLVLLPIGIWLALKMIPPQVMAECRQKAHAELDSGPLGKYLATGLIIAFWILAMALSAVCMIRCMDTLR